MTFSSRIHEPHRESVQRDKRAVGYGGVVDVLILADVEL